MLFDQCVSEFYLTELARTDRKLKLKEVSKNKFLVYKKAAQPMLRLN